MSYTYDRSLSQTGDNPVGIEKYPYMLQSPRVIGPSGPYFSKPGQQGALGALADDDTLKTLLVVLGVGLLLWFMFKGPKKNPGGRSSVAKVIKGKDGGFYWRLLRKNAKRHGPYASRADAANAAKCKGNKVLR